MLLPSSGGGLRTGGDEKEDDLVTTIDTDRRETAMGPCPARRHRRIERA
jgi:hypothetical protein